MRPARILALCAVVACSLGAAPAEPDPDACTARARLLEKRLEALRARVQHLEHELASRPKPPPREPWREPAVWRELRAGMSQADVLRILGTPGRVTTYTGFQRWEYPGALGERVNFDEAGRLLAWGALAR